MKVLVIGGGGREHALCWKISLSPLVKKIFCAPGNAGISQIAECVDISADDIEDLVNFASTNSVDLTIVGPEVPLTKGITDRFMELKLPIFGPSSKAAMLEGSKVFSKNIMKKFGLPTASYRSFNNPNKALQYLDNISFPVVIKADGLAAGKGVVIAESKEKAEEEINLMMVEGKFGNAGSNIIIEEFLTGQEASILALVDGNTILVLESSQDHKQVFDGDQGPNTGGMGAYSPAPIITGKIHKEIESGILVPIIHGMKKENITYRGLLYAGIMITNTGPKVLEFNVRFGDPETQPLLMRIKSDIVPYMLATANGTLSTLDPLEWDDRVAVCVVLTSGGYPGSYTKGEEITGIDKLEGMDDLFVFHAGTKFEGNKIVTSGGRVLGVTGLGKTIKEAQSKVYENISKIHFNNMYFRKDIGFKGI